MALHKNFPESPHAILNPDIRWFPADEALRGTSMDKLMPPLVSELRKKVKESRDRGYGSAADTSKSLLNWWFNTPHMLQQADGTMTQFQYYFAQREAMETIIYLYDVVGVQDKHDMMRFDTSGLVSGSMFDETWRRFVVKMATGTGKTKVLSLALAWSFFHKLYEPGSQLARNFLVITPNIIVLDRVYRDFQGLRIFFNDPVLPDNGVDGRNWRDDFQLTLHKQDELKVKESRDRGYGSAADTSKSLLNWWFNTPHMLQQADGTMTQFQYYFAQREAMETIIYLYDVVGVQDKHDMMRFDTSGLVSGSMFDETWRRFVVKMATGTGKTKVLSLALAWSFFHKLYEPGSQLARNFLVITPNIIVLDRVYRDFQGLRIFFNDPVLPDNGVDGRNWRDDFQLTLHKQDEVTITRPTGNIFLTNIHRIYAGDDIPPSPEDENTRDYFLGKRPTGATTDSKVDLGMIVRDIDELMILNDEAHHIHDPSMAWFR